MQVDKKDGLHFPVRLDGIPRCCSARSSNRGQRNGLACLCCVILAWGHKSFNATKSISHPWSVPRG